MIQGNLLAHRLDALPVIHSRAVQTLVAFCWQQHPDGIHFTRPGKEIQKNSYSAVFAPWPDVDDIPHFTVFSASSNILPFKQKIAYKPVDVISMIQYSDNYTQCVNELAAEFLVPDKNCISPNS